MPNIKDAISIIQSGILTLALIDYANLKPSNILGISPGKYPRIFFDKEGFNKISQLELTITSVVSNDNQSILFPIPECQLQEFTSLTFFKKFPFFF